MKYTSEIVVRGYECDSYNHVNNAVYLNYLEHGRMNYLHQIGFPYKEVVAAGFYLYVTHIDIYYKSSAFLDDKLFIDVEVKQRRAVSGMFHQTIRKEDGTICAEADVTWASVTRDGKPAKIPKEYEVPGLSPENE